MKTATVTATRLGRVETLTHGQILGLFSDYVGSNFRTWPWWE